MNKYLLLRDNKQTGPYTVPELIEKGIKPYDLVWLDGKSVAWRYPSEIEELKAYSPAVEEQPFDRFYKRPEPTVKTASITATTQQPSVEHSAYIPKVSVETTEENLPPQKKVYINFPASPSTEKKSAPAFTTAAAEKKTIAPDPIPEPVSFVEKTNYHPSDERFSSHATYPAKATSNKSHLYYAAAACLILLGFVVVLLLNNRSQNQKLKELNTIVKQIEDKKANEAAVVAQVKNVIPEPTPPQTSETIVNPELLSDNDYSKPHTQTKESVAPSAGETPVAPRKTVQPIEIAPGITYKERPVLRRADNQPQEATPPANTAKAEPASSSSENIYKQVSIKPNAYKTGVLGGISNLQFELTNNSNRELYKVAIEIKYLGPEKKVVNKQTVYFENVSPGQHSTIDVPRSKRGVSINYEITDIKS